jgi:hypothetical protein
MARGNVLVWRVRLCLVLTAAGLVHVHGGKSASQHEPEQMAAIAIPVKCATTPARSTSPLRASASGDVPAAEAGKHCGQLAGPAAPIRTTNRPSVKPEVVSPRLGAFALR